MPSFVLFISWSLFFLFSFGSLCLLLLHPLPPGASPLADRHAALRPSPLLPQPQDTRPQRSHPRRLQLRLPRRRLVCPVSTSLYLKLDLILSHQGQTASRRAGQAAVRRRVRHGGRLDVPRREYGGDRPHAVGRDGQRE